MRHLIEGQTHELLPLLDDRAMSDWCEDLDEDDVRAILARVPDECSKCVAEIEQAVVEGGLATSKRVAHRLKGMASNLGAVRLAQIARDIELGTQSVEDVSGQMERLRATLADTLMVLRSVPQGG